LHSSPAQSRPVSIPARRPLRRSGFVARLLATTLTIALPSVVSAPAGAASLPAFGGAAWSKPIGPTHLSSPTIADVNGDHHLDVVTSDLSGTVHVIDGRNGHELPGWPQHVQPRAGSTAAVESSPTVADLDRNGQKQIIVGAGSVDVPNQQGGVVAFNANGSVRFRMQTMTVAGQNGVQGTPAVGDVTGDGFADVVFGSFDHRIYALDRFGGMLPGFPIDSLDTIWDSPALYDAGHIGRMDIFLGGDASPGGPCGSQTWSGIMRAIRVTGLGPRILWSRCRHQIYQSSPAIGNLDGSGRMALVVGTGNGPSGDALATNSLNAFYLDNGANVPGWPVVLNGPIFGSPVIGDVNGNQKNDVVVAACAICNDGRVYAFNGRGGALWNRQLSSAEILSTPILADFDGNGVNDVAIGQAGSFHFLRGTNGGSLYRPIEMGRVMQNSAAVANFGPGYGWRLVIQNWLPQGNGEPKNGTGRVDSFPLPKTPRIAPAWPMWRLSPNHVAAPKSPPPAPANAGYWLVANDGGIFSFGNAKFYGSTGAMHLNQPINGMARTRSGHGYWLVASDGGIFSFGDAKFKGSTGAIHLNKPIVGMAATPSGKGYWLVASDGGIFAFGDAKFKGSTGAMHLNQPIVGMASTASGRGYWLVASDGGMFTFGDAKFYGSTGAIHLNQPITGMARTATGHGYWLVASDGGMFTFGDAKFYGSTGGQPLVAPITALTPTSSRHGYWIVGQNGDVFPFGDARFFGSTGGIALNRPIVTAAASRKT
jgi:ribosomal protein L24E